jgi:multidrug resistance protein, MATE family
MSVGLPGYAFNYVSRRYFQAQGKFSVPASIQVIVAPINIFLNYVLGKSISKIRHLVTYYLTHKVWGPEPLGMGFVGAPLATGISFDLIAILSLIVAVYQHIRDSRYNADIICERIQARRDNNTPCPLQSIYWNGNATENGQSSKQEKDRLRKIAWHPIDRKCLTDYKVLVRLGMSGIGQVAAVWWCWDFVGCKFFIPCHSCNIEIFTRQWLLACKHNNFLLTGISNSLTSLGAASLAAQSVLLISSSTVYQAPLSLSIAAAVRWAISFFTFRI